MSSAASYNLAAMDAIRERAAALLRAAGGMLSSEALMRGLFGGTGPAWAALLERTLADPRFVRLPVPHDGWRLVEEPADGLVALAIETTGQDPVRAALVQIAACRVVAGRPGPVFHTLVNPERPLPGWLAGRLGVDPALVEDAPSLAEALAQLAEFLQAATIVAFDVRWALRFLNVQCQKVGRPVFANRALDLIPAAARLTGSAKPALGVVAAKLGIPVVRRHRGGADARLIAELAVRLEPSEFHPVVDRLAEVVAVMPDAPGVYVFRSAEGEPLYVGKAKRLRRRVLSYLTRPADRERDLGGLRALTATLDWQATPDDLAAALLEMDLIAAHQPRFNTQRRAHRAPAFLELSPAEPFPRLRRVDEPGPGRFGPFASGALAAREARLVTDIFRLRRCARKLGVPRKTKPRPPCPLLARGRCLGPCTGTLPVADYRRAVAAAAAVLAGDRQAALRELQARVHAAAARGDRTESDRLRGLLRALVTRWSDDVIAPPFDPANVAILLPAGAPARAYVVITGLLRWSGPLDELSAEALAAAPTGESALRRGIVARRWLTMNRRNATIVPLPGDASAEEVVRRIVEASA
ncbi:MAG: hypothetical protein KatS3mg060_0042 [Dehalococcoidia bacterium]|nr:MAG: hypothetical protein KatS3mg060_0042 [Dehalococcoidia bacterium]